MTTYTFLLSNSYYSPDFTAINAIQAFKLAVRWWIELKQSEKDRLGVLRNFYQSMPNDGYMFGIPNKTIKTLPKKFVYKDLNVTYNLGNTI